MASKNDIPSDRLEAYDVLIASVPEIIRKGKANPYTSYNGHMFSFLSKDGKMGLRLPKNEREKFLSEYNVKLIESYGAVMKEYVTVPDDMLTDIDVLKPYLLMSLEYIKTLKPKPTTKKK